MPPCAHGLARQAAAVLAAATLGLLAAPPAEASPDTLRRALASVVGGPLDVVLSPATAGMALADNWSEVADTTAERAVYAAPGYVGLTLLQAGTGLLRTLTGALYILPGLVLFPFEMDLPPDPFSEGAGLVSLENPLGRSPVWLKWVPPLTPFTIDLDFGIVSPAGLYRREPEEPAD